MTPPSRKKTCTTPTNKQHLFSRLVASHSIPVHSIKGYGLDSKAKTYNYHVTQPTIPCRFQDGNCEAAALLATTGTNIHVQTWRACMGVLMGRLSLSVVITPSQGVPHAESVFGV